MSIGGTGRIHIRVIGTIGIVIVHAGTKIAIKFKTGSQIPSFGFLIQHVVHIIDSGAVLGNSFVLLGKLCLHCLKLTRHFVNSAGQV